MIILGVNGWMERSHDAAACLIMENQIIAMAEEERFIRQKNSFDKLPLNAIAYCLQEGKITPDEVDVVAWGWDFPLLYSLHGRRFEYNDAALNELVFPKKYYPKKSRLVPVEFIDHHSCHAASSFCCRDTEEKTAIIVLDGAGEEISASIFIGQDGMIKKVKSFPVIVSLGFFYEAACQYLGFSRTQAGKLMGLASYGRLQATQSFFEFQETDITVPFHNLQLPICGTLDWEDEIVLEWLKIFESIWGPVKMPFYAFSGVKGEIRPHLELKEREKNIAAIIQGEFERVYCWFIKQAIELTGANNIALAGGSSLNCSANGMIVNSYSDRRIFIQPMANDAGTALGAAALMMNEIPARIFCNPYLGPSYSENELLSIIRQAKVSFSEPVDFHQAVAKNLADGRVIGWFNGGMEVGPRALGARSILADPRNKDMHSIVNNVKSREFWRPLAPSVLAERAESFFTGKVFSPYMLVRSYAHPECSNAIPAVVHVDGSVRPQLVEQEKNHSFYQLIERFYKLTGMPMVLNTSFNNEREPIVCTPYDALRTFFETGIDLLAMEPFLIRK